MSKSRPELRGKLLTLAELLDRVFLLRHAASVDRFLGGVDRFLRAPEVTFICEVLSICCERLVSAVVCFVTGSVRLWLAFSTILWSVRVINFVLVELRDWVGPVVVLVPTFAVFVWRISNYARTGRVAPAAVYTALFLVVVVAVMDRRPPLTVRLLEAILQGPEAVLQGLEAVLQGRPG